MADVTGGYTGSPEDERWTRRGSGAGKIQPPATINRASQAQGMANEWLRGMMGNLGLGAPVQPQVTGDVGAPSVQPTYGGGGRGSGGGAGRVTTGVSAPGNAPVAEPQAPRGGLFTTATGAPRPGFGRAAFVGGMIPSVLAAGSELQADRPLGAITALGTGAVTSGIGTGLLKTRNPFAMAAGAGLMLAGNPLAKAAADAAEGTKELITNVPSAGKEGRFQTQMAMNRQLAELGMTQFRNNLGVETSAIKDLSKFTSDLEYLNFQRNMPLVNQMKNADLVRQQSLIASQGNQLARMSILESAGNLAQGAQSESGATLRTMLTSNPYANAVLRA